MNPAGFRARSDSMWLRVFGSTNDIPDPAGIESCLGATGTFAADERGWYRAEIPCGEGSSLTLERYLADEDGIRAELNSWAGYLETLDSSPHHVGLMERTIQTCQFITVELPDARLSDALGQHLASVTSGFYQIDSKGFFAADGTLLVAES